MSKPELIARFVIDHGKPAAESAAGHDHYLIDLAIDGVPPETYAVTYKLHETYYDPIREARNRGEGFRERITSYGDYTVQATIRTRNGVLNIAAPLSSALARGHGADVAVPAIRSAISEIKVK